MLTTHPATAANVNKLDLRSRISASCRLEDLREEFASTGVLVLPGFFSRAELAEVCREIDAHFQPMAAVAREKARERLDLRDFACDIISWDPVTEGNKAFLDLAAHERLALVTETVLGESHTAPASLVMYSVGGGQGQAWHQDCPMEDPTAFNLNRLIYIEDVEMEDGGIVVVPGSHRLGRIPPGGHQDPMKGEIALTPSAGTLILLHGHVYHRVTPNLRQKPRVSVNFRAFPAGVPASVTCIGVYRNGSVNFCDKPKMHDGTPAMA